MCLVVKFLPKISNSFLLTMASDEEWYKKFRGSVRKASKGNGCIYCSTGNCFTAFGDPEGENELRKWHREWSIMSLVEQDVHLLWIFHAGSGSCDELLPDASSRIDTRMGRMIESLPQRTMIPCRMIESLSSVMPEFLHPQRTMIPIQMLTAAAHPRVRDPVVSTTQANRGVRLVALPFWVTRSVELLPFA